MKNNDYFENLKFSYYFLNFAGVFPFDLKRRGTLIKCYFIHDVVYFLLVKNIY